MFALTKLKGKLSRLRKHDRSHITLKAFHMTMIIVRIKNTETIFDSYPFSRHFIREKRKNFLPTHTPFHEVESRKNFSLVEEKIHSKSL